MKKCIKLTTISFVCRSNEPIHFMGEKWHFYFDLSFLRLTYHDRIEHSKAFSRSQFSSFSSLYKMIQTTFLLQKLSSFTLEGHKFANVGSMDCTNQREFQSDNREEPLLPVSLKRRRGLLEMGRVEFQVSERSLGRGVCGGAWWCKSSPQGKHRMNPILCLYSIWLQHHRYFTRNNILCKKILVLRVVQWVHAGFGMEHFV